jgi:hypothetical protein
MELVESLASLGLNQIIIWMKIGLFSPISIFDVYNAVFTWTHRSPRPSFGLLVKTSADENRTSFS